MESGAGKWFGAAGGAGTWNLPSGPPPIPSPPPLKSGLGLGGAPWGMGLTVNGALFGAAPPPAAVGSSMKGHPSDPSDPSDPILLFPKREEPEEENTYTPYEFIEGVIRLKGKQIELTRRPWWRDVYDLTVRSAYGDVNHIPRRNILLKTGRQSEKSTSIGNLFLALCCLVPELRCLYVTASQRQQREFSDERLRAVISDSPFLQLLSGIGIGVGTRAVQNVMTKYFVNGSKINIASANRNADRIRGNSADVLAVDEIQSIRTDILPVIEEVLFASSAFEDGPISVYAGTPLSLDNPLEYYWAQHSTQQEWMTKCEGCNTWSVIGIDNIRDHGLQCTKCDTELDPVSGTAGWVRMGPQNAQWEGYHISQPIAIYVARNNPVTFKQKWEKLIAKKKRYTLQKFANEVMGVSYDSGAKPVSSEQIRNCCLSHWSVERMPPPSAIRTTQKWAGIDWGGGEVSFSILSIWRYDTNGRFCCIYIKKYTGIEADPTFVIADMIRTCKAFNITRIGADWGFGFDAHPQMRKAFGAKRYVPMAHVNTQKEMIAADTKGNKLITHRSRVMGLIFQLIRKGPVPGGIVFPKWSQFEESARDIAAIYQEYDERARQLIYDHPVTVPDDFFNTMVYALIASMFDHQRPDLTAPDKNN